MQAGIEFRFNFATRLVSRSIPVLTNLFFQVIEGLENMENLVELHIENQKLFMGEKMHLEPESLSALQSLQVLNISNNGIDKLEFVATLPQLGCLRCENNNLTDLDDLTVLKKCLKLQKVGLIRYEISIGDINRF